MVEKDKVVSINYTLKDDQNNVIDQSTEQEPLLYLHGHQNIIPGLENQLTGKNIGDEIKVTVEPKDGYGEYLDELVQEATKDQFQGVADLKEGLQVQAMTSQGPMIFQIIKVDGENITLDGNHPLAGQTLHFEVKILEVRDASEEELQHGHVHGPGGHHH